MPNQQPTIQNVRETREFVCSPVAVPVFVVDSRERVLLLSNPKYQGTWQVVCGAMERAETVLEAAMRELREEAGPNVRARPLGGIHSYSFAYDDNVQYMICTAYLMAYEGGDIEPGDDMAGSSYRWFTLDEIESEQLRIVVPVGQRWLFRRAVELYRMLIDQPEVQLEPSRDQPPMGPYPPAG